MNNMDPLRFLRFYLGFKAHFTNEKYDIIEKKGAVKGVTYHNFLKRNDHQRITNLAKSFNHTRDATTFLLANFALKNVYPFEDIEYSEKLCRSWIKLKESLTYTFKQDILFINEFCETNKKTFRELFYSKNGNIPIILQMYLANRINITSLCIMDKILDYTSEWLVEYKLWYDDILRIKKLGSFIRVDETKFKTIMERIIER